MDGSGTHTPVVLRISAFEDDEEETGGSAADGNGGCGGGGVRYRAYEVTAPRRRHRPPKGIYSPCFTPDGQFVLCGSADGVLWDASRRSSSRCGEGSPYCVRWNPKRAMAASGCFVSRSGLAASVTKRVSTRVERIYQANNFSQYVYM